LLNKKEKKKPIDNLENDWEGDPEYFEINDDDDD